MTITLALSFATAVYAQTESTAVRAVNQEASTIGFTIHGSMIFKIKREGRFRDFAGTFAYDPGTPSNTHVDLTVYTASVDMHDAEHDQLLKSGEFFDVAHFPTMHFASSSTEVRPDGTLSITGDMTIRGVTKTMTIPAKLRRTVRADDRSGATFETTFPIDRTAFGINGDPGWGGFILKISNNIDIHLTIATAAVTR